MALPSQIDVAARGDAPPPSVGTDLNDEAVLAMPSQDKAVEAVERADAAQMVRRIANRHGCEGLCDRPEHARDVAGLGPMLAMLGLDRDVPTSYTMAPESVAPVVAKLAARRPMKRTVPRTQPAKAIASESTDTKECTRCQHAKPVGDFYARHPWCKPCHQQANMAAQSERRAQAQPKPRPVKPRTRPAKKGCSKCGEIKASSEFYAESRHPDGLRSECRKCFNSQRSTRRKAVAA